MLEGGRHLWERRGRAVYAPHHALGEQKVAEETGDEEVLSEELLEEIGRQHVPGDGVSDGREDPVEFAERRLAVVKATRNLLDRLERNARENRL